MYSDAKATSNVLYSGDRGGSHYFDVMENTASTETGNAWSGNLQPGFSNRVKSYVVNPFIKCHGFEFFGNFETSTGGSAAETTGDRTWRQNSGDFIYRFLPSEAAYVAYRYNKAVGQLVGTPVDVNIVRTQFAARPVPHEEHPDQDRIHQSGLQQLPRDGHPQWRQLQRRDDLGSGRVLTAVCPGAHRAPPIAHR